MSTISIYTQNIKVKLLMSKPVSALFFEISIEPPFVNLNILKQLNASIIIASCYTFVNYIKNIKIEIYEKVLVKIFQFKIYANYALQKYHDNRKEKK